jgi:isopropylmalate/homocitrate/citramalate synthase
VKFPVTVLNWRAEKAYKEFGARVKAEAKKRNLFKDVKKFSKKQHKQRMEDSKLFSFVKEVTLHNIEYVLM